ncbi:hypothetical protein IW262DRAFT_892297 [Armillaria fumosa]|nr:hypothetical protein IW262DRAFT_892297 [Armillaria fumosa]
MSLQSSMALPSIGETFCACYIGSLIAAVFYGISNLQVFFYYKRYPNDWWVCQYSIGIAPLIRSFMLVNHGRVVYCLRNKLLDDLRVVFSTHVLYYYMIKMFGKFNGLDRILWSMKLQWCLLVA